MNILGMGPMEILLIVVLALIVFGPAKLPEIMGQVGKAINDFRRATSELSDEFNRTIQAELQETRSVIDEAKSAVSDVQANVADVRASVTGMPAPTRPARGPNQHSRSALVRQHHCRIRSERRATSSCPRTSSSDWVSLPGARGHVAR